MFDILITGGTIYDGTGVPGRRADLGINGEQITAVDDLSTATAARMIDAGDAVPRERVTAAAAMAKLGASETAMLTCGFCRRALAWSPSQ